MERIRILVPGGACTVGEGTIQRAALLPTETQRRISQAGTSGGTFCHGRQKTDNRRSVGSHQAVSTFQNNGALFRRLRNHLKAIFDGLNQIVFADDSQVIRCLVEKHTDAKHPRAEIELETFSLPSGE